RSSVNRNRENGAEADRAIDLQKRPRPNSDAAFFILWITSMFLNHIAPFLGHRNGELTKKIKWLTSMKLTAVPGDVRNVPSYN
ncbi:hypothetical protein NOI66_11570, partial [Neorhizobium galegae]|uniref:hypothetical protein n=1 Tax=Neorhizobium galegae TaxID=399 RepID=UPI002101F3D7